MQQIVKQIYERFVNGPIDPQLFSLRIITIAIRIGVNGRWLGCVRLKSTRPAFTAGCSTRELGHAHVDVAKPKRRSRNTAPRSPLINGQSHNIDQLRSRNYVREIHATGATLPGLCPGQRRDSRRLSPAIQSVDEHRSSHDGYFVKCSIDQGRETQPSPGRFARRPAAVYKPRPSTYRSLFHGDCTSASVGRAIKFSSCRAASSPPPDQPSDNTLLNSANGNGLFGLGRLLPKQAGSRSDALLIVEYRGPAARNSEPRAARRARSRGRRLRISHAADTNRMHPKLGRPLVGYKTTKPSLRR